MSLIAITPIQEAASLILDPGYSRIPLSTWTTIFNRVQRKMCSRMDILEDESYFNVGTEDRYAYPEDTTHITDVRYTDNPADEFSYRFLTEMTRDEWRAKIDGNYPVGTPDSYVARTRWFQLYPKPDLPVVNGGLVSYFHMPTIITDPNTGYVEVPDFAQDHLVEGMVIEAMLVLNMVAESTARYARWINVLEPEVKWRIEDRSDDRRPSFRPSATGITGGHV